MARHSGDFILRYVADAPLKSLRADLGLRNLPSKDTPSLQFMQNGGTSTSALVRARVRKPDASLLRLEGVMQAQAQDVVAMATGFARTDNRVYEQSCDNGHTVCGWPYARARKRGPGQPYRRVNSLVDMPGAMMCEKCSPIERAIAV